MEDNRKDTRTQSEIQEQKLKDAMAKRKRRKVIRTIVTWVLIAAVLFVLYTYYKSIKEKSAAAIANMNKTVTVEREVEEIEYSVKIDVSGYVEPNDIQNAKFRSTGTVTGVFVEEGDHVKKGQLLASIDNTNETSNLQNIRNQIEEAELNGNTRQLEQLKLQEKTALNKLDYTNIYANFDGVVATVDVAVGDYFDAGSAAITIADISTLKAKVEIDEIDRKYIYEGMPAYITCDSIPGQTVVGEVSYIPMLGRYSQSGIGVVDVVITIENPPAELVPGFSFEGNLYADGKVSMKTIPQAAVTTGAGGLTTVDLLLPGGKRETTPVNVKYLGEGLCQILSENINVGDTVVYETRRGNGGGFPAAMMMGY